MMVGSSGGKMIVNSGKWPSGVCEKGIQTKKLCSVHSMYNIDSQAVQWCAWWLVAGR